MLTTAVFNYAYYDHILTFHFTTSLKVICH